MAAVIVSDDEIKRIDAIINGYKAELRWREEAEFKFSKTKKELIKELLKRLSDCDFEICAIFVNKELGLGYYHVDEDLYPKITKILLESLELPNITVKIDGYKGKKYRNKFVSIIRRPISGQEVKIDKIGFGDSKKDNLLQLSDLVVGAIARSLRHDDKKSSEMLRIFENKIRAIKEIKMKNLLQ